MYDEVRTRMPVRSIHPHLVRTEEIQNQGSGTRPRDERCLEKVGYGRGLVNISEVISAVGIHDVSKVPSSTFS